MDTRPNHELMNARAVRLWAEGRMIWLALVDGRVIGFPADGYKLLKAGTDAQLAQVQLNRNGEALHWEELDEDLTVAGVLRGEFELPL
jgi:Protein of unknown function (DUF2442)